MRGTRQRGGWTKGFTVIDIDTVEESKIKGSWNTIIATPTVNKYFSPQIGRLFGHKSMPPPIHKGNLLILVTFPQNQTYYLV